MCGIAGWFDPSGRIGDRRERLQRMCAVMEHRGPDDQGFYLDEKVALGFQRLSIVDLAGGAQPMSSANGSICVVFNGEIYNYKELKAELAGSGEIFKTDSDTEVLLKAYERWGLQAFDRFNGMFAVAIWDKRSATLYLVRDRMGVKPLYYARVGDALLFGSEIKAILASGLVDRRVEEKALWDYFTFRYVPGPQTIWQGVYSVPPGNYLSVGAVSPFVVKSWWKLKFSEPSQPSSDDEYEIEFERLFQDAVRLRMRADVPVGITLSGGIDSSAVVAAAQKCCGTVKTFSVSFSDSPTTDETQYALSVARHFHTDHHEIRIGLSEFTEFLPNFVRLTDQPLADLASIPLHYVCRLASEQVKVVLSGEGSDEILAGYTFDRLVKAWDEAATRATPGTSVQSAVGYLLARLRGGSRHRRNAQSKLLDLRSAQEPLSMTNYYNSSQKKSFLKIRGDWPDSLELVRAQMSEGGAAPLNQVLAAYCQDWLVEDLLTKADRMSMGNSVELRTPFLDFRLVEFCCNLPTRLKAGKSAKGSYRSKELLRRYAENVLPAAIIDRPKMGFPVPVYGWLAGDLKTWACEILQDKNVRIEAFMDRQAVRQLLQRAIEPSGEDIDRHRLWNLIVLELWMREWL